MALFKNSCLGCNILNKTSLSARNINRYSFINSFFATERFRWQRNCYVSYLVSFEEVVILVLRQLLDKYKYFINLSYSLHSIGIAHFRTRVRSVGPVLVA